MEEEGNVGGDLFFGFGFGFGLIWMGRKGQGRREGEAWMVE